MPYHVSRARSDVGDGSRYFYNMKDLALEFVNKPLTDQHCIIMTDVDYYVDMPRWLQTLRPIMLYTLVPTKLACRTEEYCYRLKDGKIEFDVAGGANYSHQLWDYVGDTITVKLDCGGVATYSLEQRLIPGDEEHRFIVLSPTSFMPRDFVSLLPLETAHYLKRKDLSRPYLYEPISDVLSLAKPNSYHSVELPGRVYHSIVGRLACKTSPALVVDVERMLRDSHISDAHLMAPIVYDLMGLSIEKNVILTSSLDANYHPLVNDSLTHEDMKPTGVPASSNLVFPGACFPTKTQASELATVQGRIQKVRNNKEPPRLFKQYANDFITQLVNKPRKGQPWTAQRVVEYQNSPMQRQRSAQVQATMSLQSTNRLSSFVKAEAYSTPNDPRNITTMSTECTILMSCYSYAFKEEVLKKQPFYSPGMTPHEVVDRLKQLTTELGVISTDYSRFDGSISRWLQEHVVHAAYSRWVSLEKQEELNWWFNQVFVDHARTKSGIKYDPGFGTRSGSPITTDGNTMINAFVVFAALVKMGRTPKEAFKLLGLYCGDDGFNANLPGLRDNIISVCETLGLKIDVEVLNSGPYPYLGRRFIDPSLSGDSYQDLYRTLPKLHVVANGPETIEQRLTNKAFGYLVTDPHTPLLSNWAKKVISLTKLGVKNLTHEERYKINSPWPQENPSLIRKAVCDDFGIDDIELTQLENLIDSATSLETLPVVFEWTPDVKLHCVRSGLLESPREHNDIDTVVIDSVVDKPTIQSSPNEPIITERSENSGSLRFNPTSREQQPSAAVQCLHQVAKRDSNCRRPFGAKLKGQASKVYPKFRNRWCSHESRN